MGFLRGPKAGRPLLRAAASVPLIATATATLAIAMATATATAPSLAAESTAGLVAWGANSTGELGNGTTAQANLPVGGSGLSGVTAVAAGIGHSLALLSNGTVMAWGENTHGQLGNGTTTNSSVPVAVSGLSGVTAIAAGGHHSLALLGNGTVMAWGEASRGQLGNGTINDSDVPVEVKELSGVTAIAAGASHCLALLGNGTVMAWGSDNNGQLGNGTTVRGEVLPVPVSGLSGVTGIAAGGTHSLALLSNTTAMAWGLNSSGQLGNGTTTNSNVPVAVSGLTGATELSGGGADSLALLSNGTAMAWGNNSAGQLGNGTTTNSVIPVAVGGLSGATEVAAGGHHSLALLGNGTLMSWGGNGSGQLGIGTTTNSSVPVAVSTIGEVQGIAGGDTYSLAFGPQLAAVTSVTPNNGPPGGGTSVTIAGTNFTGATAVKFGPNNATSFTVNSATSITATSPSGTGNVDVTVTGPGGTSGPVPSDKFNYGPNVTSISPKTGPQAGGTTVTIAGTNFSGATAVKFGANNATSFTVNSATSITATSPAGGGVVDVTVTSPGGTSPVTSADKFSYEGVPPEFGRCLKVGPGLGAFSSGTCITPVAGGAFEWFPGVLSTRTAFTSSGGESALESIGKTKVACKTELGKGEYTGPKTVGKVVIRLKECLLGTVKCATPEARAGEIVTTPLEGALQWLNKAEATVALDLFPVGGSGLLLKAQCGTTTIEVKGSLLVKILAGKMVKETTLNYTAIKGIQNPSEYETPAGVKVKDFLELSTVAGKFEQAGLTLKMVVKSKEKVEVNTFI